MRSRLRWTSGSRRSWRAATWLAATATCLAVGCLSACEGGEPVSLDAGGDAGPDDAAMDARAPDGGVADAAPEASPGDAAAADAGGILDAGPPVTGCELLGRDAGAPSRMPRELDALVGPGGPSVVFPADQLLAQCAFLNGGPTDQDHHNTVLVLDGLLWMPWAHQAGGGAISVFEFDEPCDPVHVVTSTDEQMRESHSVGIAYLGGRRWMVVASLGGIQFWDITDLDAIRMVHDLALPDVTYPDAYARVVMSVFWQAPYVYVGASDNGVFVVDASDPEAPELVAQVRPQPEFRVGGVHAIGTLLVVLPSEGSRVALLDISDPARPRPLPGGSFLITDGGQEGPRPSLRTAYFSHVNGNRTYHARHIFGGGLIVYDISDPRAPEFTSSYWAEPGANGGYVFVKEDLAFVGLSNWGEVIDISDPAAPEPVSRIDMTGDLDTLVPVGNVIVASVDDDAVPGEATAVYPYQAEVDARAPAVNMVVPRDGETEVALSARIGVTFHEFVEMETVGTPTFFVRPVGSEEPLPGTYSGQEGAANFWPAAPLAPATTYEVIVPAEGVTDYNGNTTTSDFRATFTTAACGNGAGP